jgi:hypothetical protein
MNGLKPTFLNDRDRFTYLLAEYKWILALGLGFTAVGLIVVVQPDLPTLSIPSWFSGYLVWSVITLIPGYLAGIRVVLWLRNRNDVTVYEINAPNKVAEKWYVPPETWTEKTVERGSPWTCNDGDDYMVRQLDYDQETEQLHVRGIRYADMSDDAVVTSKKRMERIYDDLMETRTRYNQIEAQWDEMVARLQSTMINAFVEARQRGVNLKPDKVMDIWEDATTELETVDEFVDDDQPIDSYADFDTREDQNGTAEATFGTPGGDDE